MRRQRTQSTEVVRSGDGVGVYSQKSFLAVAAATTDDSMQRQVLVMTIGRATPSGGGTRPPSHRAGPVGSAHRHATAEAPPFPGRAGTCRLGAEKC